MIENETRIVVEEWLDELISELSSGQRNDLRKAVKRNSTDELYQILIMFIKNLNPTLELVETQVQTCGLLVI